MNENKIQKLKRESIERFWQQVAKAAREGTLKRLSLPAKPEPKE